MSELLPHMTYEGGDFNLKNKIKWRNQYMRESSKGKIEYKLMNEGIRRGWERGESLKK
jgi:hypothetical protein